MIVYFGLLFVVVLLAMFLNRYRFVHRRTSSNYGSLCLNEDKKHSSGKSNTLCFIVVFLLLAGFSAVRDGIGSDYNAYIWHIQKIQAGLPHYMEIGFQTLVRFLYKVDTNPRLIMVVMSVFTCFFYVKTIWDESEDVVLSLFLFLSWGYYFLTLTTVRNYFAVSLVLFSLRYFIKKRYIIFVTLVLFAATFHKTALICIPVYFLAKRKFKKTDIIIVVLIIALGLLFRRQIRTLAFRVYPQYENSAYDNGEISLLNILKAVLIIMLFFLFNKGKVDDKTNFYLNLNLFSLVFYAGMYYLPESSRIGFYMNTTSILLIPHLLRSIRNNQTRDNVKLVIFFGSLILFFLLCRGFAGPTIRLLPYKTWLFDGSYRIY